MPSWLSLVDVGFLAVALLFAWGGCQKGFAGQIAHILTFFIMGVFLFFGYPALFSYLRGLLRGAEETYLMWLILAATFALGVGVFVLTTKLLAGVVKAQITERADHVWGFVLGFVRGLLLALFGVMLLVMLDASGRVYDKFRAKSHVGRMVCYEVVPRVQPHLTRAVLEEKTREWKDFLLEQEEAGVLE